MAQARCRRAKGLRATGTGSLLYKGQACLERGEWLISSYGTETLDETWN